MGKPYTVYVGSVGRKKAGNKIMTVWTAGHPYTEDQIASMLNGAYQAGIAAERARIAIAVENKRTKR